MTENIIEGPSILTTTESFVTILKIDVSKPAPATFTDRMETDTESSSTLVDIMENNVNDVAYQILGAVVDETAFQRTIVPSTTLAKQGTAQIELLDKFLFFYVQVKDNVNGIHGSVTATAIR